MAKDLVLPIFSLAKPFPDLDEGGTKDETLLITELLAPTSQRHHSLFARSKEGKRSVGRCHGVQYYLFRDLHRIDCQL